MTVNSNSITCITRAITLNSPCHHRVWAACLGPRSHVLSFSLGGIIYNFTAWEGNETCLGQTGQHGNINICICIYVYIYIYNYISILAGYKSANRWKHMYIYIYILCIIVYRYVFFSQCTPLVFSSVITSLTIVIGSKI